MSVALREALSGAVDDERRVEGYYLPVCTWLAGVVGRAARRPVVVAVNGPQGSGKSTLCATAVRALEATGLRAVTVSIDDFYLTHDAQRALAERFPGNRYLEHRGYPGTHDIALGCAVLDGLRGDRGEGVKVPVYDKSAHGGRGDRMDEAHWRTEHGPFDVVLLEGWMLGFAPIAAGALPDAAMAPANEALAAYEAWHARCDALVALVMAETAYVVNWRVDAERARRAAGAPGLSDEEARDYVMRFVPAYEAWVPGLLASPTVRGPRLVVTLGEDRHSTGMRAA